MLHNYCKKHGNPYHQQLSSSFSPLSLHRALWHQQVVVNGICYRKVSGKRRKKLFETSNTRTERRWWGKKRKTQHNFMSVSYTHESWYRVSSDRGGVLSIWIILTWKKRNMKIPPSLSEYELCKTLKRKSFGSSLEWKINFCHFSSTHHNIFKIVFSKVCFLFLQWQTKNYCIFSSKVNLTK